MWTSQVYGHHAKMYTKTQQTLRNNYFFHLTIWIDAKTEIPSAHDSVVSVLVSAIDEQASETLNIMPILAIEWM